MKNYRSLSPKVKDTIAIFIKAAIMIVLILLAFNWLSSRYNLKSQLSKVSGEVWLGTITAIANDIQKKKADLEPDRPDDPGKVPLDCKSLDDSTEVNQC